ncbi:MAG: hypothetical protein K9J42_07580 [Sulfuritalea sp.]|nr:hypothetical protein [Sulfuritalea sp.]
MVVLGFMSMGAATAQVNKEPWMENFMRGGKLQATAEEKAMEQCEITRAAFSIPAYNVSTKTEVTRNVTVAIEWNGGCLDGKRDGEGILSWTTDAEGLPVSTDKGHVLRSRSEGRFVKGRRLGLWCTTGGFDTRTSGGVVQWPTSCSIFAGHATRLTSAFRKQSDGSWHEFLGNRATGTTVAAGVLEAQSAKVLAEAGAGATNLKANVVAKNQMLDDLVRGSNIALARSDAQVSLQGKRVAVVFSSNMIQELARFKRDREQLIAASNGLSGSAAEYRDKFIAASNPDKLLVNVAKTLLKYGATAQPADDLGTLQGGQVDYGFILDWKYTIPFDLLGKFDSIPDASPTPGVKGGGLFCQSMGGFLINRDLKAIKDVPVAPLCLNKFSGQSAGDSGYMLMLNRYFMWLWGDGPDKLGSIVYGFDRLLKN